MLETISSRIASSEIETEARKLEQRYRPDVDGLRAVAVGLVVAYHLAPRLVPNGFIGVDIFFVISGFVVTASVLARPRTSLIGDVFSFWKRRVVRIYPPLLVVILVTTVVSALFIPPFPGVVFNSVIRTGALAMFGAANLYLYRSGQGYFTADQSSNPFLHTWSLGVEEQFYLFFSLVFLALAVLIARGRDLTKVRFLLFGIFTVASVLLLVRAGGSDPSGAYYLPQFRFWELGLGVLVALAHQSSWALPPWACQLARVCAPAAVIAIFWLAILPSRPDPTLSIALGSVLSATIIGLGSISGSIAKTLLSTPPMRGMGLISYSLYLWHWPIVVFFKLTVGLLSAWTICLALALTLGSAVATYFLVERRLRSAQARFWRQTAPALGILATATLVIGSVAQLAPGAGFLGHSEAWSRDWLPSATSIYGGQITQSRCDSTSGSLVPAEFPEGCFVRSNPPAHTLSIVGDSLGFADWGMVSAASGNIGWAALTHDGCNINTSEPLATAACRQYWATMPQRIRGSLRHGDSVLVAVFWPIGSGASYSSGLAKLNALINAADEVGATVIVQAPLPRFARPAFLCTTEWFRSSYDGCTIQRADFELQRAAMMHALRRLRTEHSNLIIWDPTNELCDARQCSEFSGEHPLFRDNDHLSYWGSRSLGPSFEHFLGVELFSRN